MQYNYVTASDLDLGEEVIKLIIEMVCVKDVGDNDSELIQTHQSRFSLHHNIRPASAGGNKHRLRMVVMEPVVQLFQVTDTKLCLHTLFVLIVEAVSQYNSSSNNILDILQLSY